jgi:hypothetical protein
VLAGPSNPPDPRHNAFRKDLADVALAGRVVSSHFAAPVPRILERAAALYSDPAVESEVICKLSEGDPFELLDNSVGWAWGYGGPDRRVGYVESDALGCA